MSDEKDKCVHPSSLPAPSCIHVCETIPVVLGRWQTTPWTSHQVITGPHRKTHEHSRSHTHTPTDNLEFPVWRIHLYTGIIKWTWKKKKYIYILRTLGYSVILVNLFLFVVHCADKRCSVTDILHLCNLSVPVITPVQLVVFCGMNKATNYFLTHPAAFVFVTNRNGEFFSIGSCITSAALVALILSKPLHVVC